MRVSILLPRDVVRRTSVVISTITISTILRSSPMFNRMLIDLKGMLTVTHGFKMGNAEIEPPKSISTATRSPRKLSPGCQPYLWRHHH